MFGGSTMFEGITQTSQRLIDFLWGPETSTGYNPVAQATVNVVQAAGGGAEAQRRALAAYYMADMVFSIAGGIDSLRRAASQNPYTLEHAYKLRGAEKIPQYHALAGNISAKMIKKASQGYMLRVVGNSMEAVSAGDLAYESAQSLTALTPNKVRVGGLTADQAAQIAKQMGLQ